MAITADERDDRLEERAKALGHVPNYCPCGCGREDLDEYGYCEHLVGFTNDGKTIETIQKRLRRVKDQDTGEVTKEDTQLRFVSGNKKSGHVAQVQPGDKLVNPERIERDGGLAAIVKSWVSARVYRPGPQAARDEVADEGPDEGPNAKPAKAKKKRPAPAQEAALEEAIPEAA